MVRKSTTTTSKTASKKRVTKKSSSPKRTTKKQTLMQKMQQYRSLFLARRPHRSFRRTRRRDYARSMKLPGYFSFTLSVVRSLLAYRRVFLYQIIVLSALTIVFAGATSQEGFRQLADLLNDAGKNVFSGGWGEIGKAGLLLLTGVGGMFSGQPSEAQQIFSMLLFLLIWLMTIWLMRAHMAGNRPSLRDALYNSSAPLVSTLFVALLLVVQLLPITLAIIGYNAAIATDFFASGPLAMILAFLAGLLALLSLYLIVSTFFALVIVTLPGMYPWQALRTAGDLVTGRRLRILLRLAWMLVVISLAWAVIMVPIILLATWLQTSVSQINWIPIVPVCLVIMTTTTLTFATSYVYLLYRGMVDDASAPA